MDLNKVQIIWNITQDLELKQTPNGQNVMSFSIATNRSWLTDSWEKKEQAEFHNIVFWGKLAEIANDFLAKWKKVYVEWRLQTRTWEAQDWTKRYKTEIIWENMIMLDSKGWDNRQDTNDYSKNKTVPKKVEEILIEDIPF